MPSMYSVPSSSTVSGSRASRVRRRRVERLVGFFMDKLAFCQRRLATVSYGFRSYPASPPTTVDDGARATGSAAARRRSARTPRR